MQIICLKYFDGCVTKSTNSCTGLWRNIISRIPHHRHRNDILFISVHAAQICCVTQSGTLIFIFGVGVFRLVSSRNHKTRMLRGFFCNQEYDYSCFRSPMLSSVLVDEIRIVRVRIIIARDRKHVTNVIQWQERTTHNSNAAFVLFLLMD